MLYHAAIKSIGAHLRVKKNSKKPYSQHDLEERRNSEAKPQSQNAEEKKLFQIFYYFSFPSGFPQTIFFNYYFKSYILEEVSLLSTCLHKVMNFNFQVKERNQNFDLTKVTKTQPATLTKDLFFIQYQLIVCDDTCFNASYKTKQSKSLIVRQL